MASPKPAAIIAFNEAIIILPKLANLQDKNQISKEIGNGYKLIMPFVIGSAIIIYLIRSFIIRLLFAKSFSAMDGMFAWQLVGDCFKIATYLVSYLVLARAKTKIFMLTEVLFGISFPVLSYSFINLIGANGAVMAFALNYMIYFILFVVLYKKGYLF